jgi:hypothetical protein
VYTGRTWFSHCIAAWLKYDGYGYHKVCRALGADMAFHPKHLARVLLMSGQR